MGYDAMANATSTAAAAAAAAAAPRDIVGPGKKKRANRSAKLKQCKLDARREQWLSQVKNKNSQGTITALSPTSHLLPPALSLPRARTGQSDSALHESSDSESPLQSPTWSSSGCVSRKGCAVNSIGSSCSVESSSRNVSDSELEDGEVEAVHENGALDDWEAVADALSAGNDCMASVIKPVHERPSGHNAMKPEPIHPPPRAWRPDDASRPRSLPSLGKQQNFVGSIERLCGLSHSCSVLSSQSTCPICCEDLDVTDSSFLPCSCGFRLCLFCHKRILEEDGRCPGCRKQYISMVDGAVDVRDLFF